MSSRHRAGVCPLAPSPGPCVRFMSRSPTHHSVSCRLSTLPHSQAVPEICPFSPCTTAPLGMLASFSCKLATLPPFSPLLHQLHSFVHLLFGSLNTYYVPEPTMCPHPYQTLHTTVKDIVPAFKELTGYPGHRESQQICE